jgi:hypothetical protein
MPRDAPVGQPAPADDTRSLPPAWRPSDGAIRALADLLLSVAARRHQTGEEEGRKVRPDSAEGAMLPPKG